MVAYGVPPAVASPCSEAAAASKSAPRHWAWAALMRRAFDLDVLACPRCEPRLADQELMVGPRYWEGAVGVAGTAAGRLIAGQGYVELVGYGE